MKIRNVSIIGLGAVGSTVFPYLSRYLPFTKVRVIAGGERKKRLEQSGVVINTISYPVYVTDPTLEVPAADLLIVAVKYSQLHSAIADIGNHVGPQTIILSLMNGVDSREHIGRVYGIEKCLYGFCHTSTVNLGNNHFKVSPHEAGIQFGEAENTSPYSERVQAVANLFTASGITFKISKDMVHDIWWKFMLNVSGNSTNTLLRGTHQYFQKLDAANQARRLMMEEIVALSQVMNTHLSTQDIDEVLQAYQAYPAENKCSTLQDLEAGRRTENDMFCGEVVRLGKIYHVPTPINHYVYKVIEALDDVNAGALENKGLCSHG